jgi:hypothetical protein
LTRRWIWANRVGYAMAFRIRHFALSSLRRDFVATDRERESVKYEDFQGHKLDRKMLEVVTAVTSAAGDPLSAFRNLSAGAQFASRGSRKEAQHQ